MTSKISVIIRKQLKLLPKLPGIYQFFNSKNEIIYIGKAKNLKNRVSSYFQKNESLSEKNKKLVKQIAKMEISPTSSELESLLLEANLIAAHRPIFNILLRDDKNFLFVEISEDFFPMIRITRKINKKSNRKYFGPFPRAGEIRKTFEILQEILQFRTCKIFFDDSGKILKNPENKKIPCLEYQINRCCAPCFSKISPLEYAEKINLLVDFFNGKTRKIKEKIKEKMKKFAVEKKFEIAAKMRDVLLEIEKISQPQFADIDINFSGDAVGTFFGARKSFFTIFAIRNGKISRITNHCIENSNDEKETLENFLREYFYFFPQIPKKILLPDIFSLQKKDLLEKFFYKISNTNVEILTPVRGKKKKILELADKSAAVAASNSRASFEKFSPGLSEIQTFLNLPEIPERIECFDISHFSGKNPVGSQVVFCGENPEKSEYRHYNLHNPAGNDDFASMKEIFTRRFFKISSRNNLQIKKISQKKNIAKVDQLLKKAGLIVDLPAEQQFEFLEKTSGKKIGFARFRRREKFLEIGGVFVLPEFRSMGMGTEIIRILVEKTKEKVVRVMIRQKNIRWKITLQRIGFRAEKKPPKVFQKFCEERCKNEKIPMEVLKISPQKFRQETEKIPDLILVDGGKGQLSAAVSVLKKLKLQKIPIAAIAKKNEEIFVPNSNKPIKNLTKNSSGNLLLQKIRNEAHRFAISFHRFLREKI